MASRLSVRPERAQGMPLALARHAAGTSGGAGSLKVGQGRPHGRRQRVGRRANMGLFDEIKDKAEELKDKAVELVQGNSDKVDEAVEKAGDLIDEKTGGQFSDKVDMAQEKAKEVADDLDQAN